MEKFEYQPSKWVPFRDKEVIEKVRKIKREDILNHPNPNLNIKILPADEIEFIWITDMFYRIKKASEENKKVVMITPNPCPRIYKKVAYLINKFRVNCKNLYTFNMDEYADENGNIAPETWEFGFMYAFKKYFYYQIDEKLRPPENQIQGPTNENIKDYGKMIADLGGADICYSGPGWTGHVAFIEPDAPEFDAPLEEWLKMGPRIVTLSPFTIAQNSLHGFFGKSGDLAAVPPKAATIGPAEIVGAKERMEFHAITVHNTTTSWQRFISRLALFGPVTPKVPSSIFQLLKTDVYISEEIAQDIEPDWNKGY